MRDWYDYLAEDFKLPRRAYTVNDKAAVTCPRCQGLDMVRINHLKNKIKTLGFYECSTCRKRDSIARARDSFKSKYGVDSPFELKSVQDKIKGK